MSTAEYGAIVALHRGLARLGPGDDGTSDEILATLPQVPSGACIADLGCGTGAGALLLARRFPTARIIAIDAEQGFLDDLHAEATRQGVQDRIELRCADIAAPGLPPSTIDVIWSEGAAYNIGFDAALAAWRPMLRAGGVAVISELSWFTEEPPAALRRYWEGEYPGMADEGTNVMRARNAGYEVLGVRRLPPRAWDENYYGPMSERLAARTDDPALASVVRATREEMELHARHHRAFGYAFYVLRAGPEAGSQDG